MVSQGNISIKIPAERNAHFYDVDLTDYEMRMLSGTYVCYTGNGNQVSYKSWFPPHIEWDRTNGMNRHRWTDMNEHDYKKHVGEILAGKERPRTSSSWRDLLSGRKEARHL
ncbi:hypothetical protein BDN72DRAFT_779672, partial [Pluteus cervinus]